MSGRDRGDSGSARLHLRATSFQAFIEEYSPRVSSEGILLPTDEGWPQGSVVEFEISLSDDFRVLRGVGEVAWFADPSGRAGDDGGLALRFTRLEAPSRRLIERLVERHRDAGGHAFSLVQWPEAVSSPTDTELDSRPTLFGSLDEEGPDPEIVLSPERDSEAGYRAGRPSRTPAGEDSVLIPAPAFDGEPLPSARGSARAATPLEARNRQDGDFAIRESEEGSPIDTLHVPPVVRPDPAAEWESAVAFEPGADLAMETVRVESLAPAAPSAVSSSTGHTSSEVGSGVAPRPRLPMAGVARAGGHGRARRPLLLLLVLVVAAGATVVLRGERFGSLWSRLRGGAVEVVPAARPEPTRSTPTQSTPSAVDPVAGIVAGVAEGPAEPPPSVDPDTPIARAPETDLQPAVEVAPPVEVAGTPPDDAMPLLTRILSVTSGRVGEETEIRLVADGRFAEGAFNGTRVQGGMPRILIRVLGVEVPFGSSSVQVGTPEVERVRVGLHPSGARFDLHFVADLTSERVRLVSAEASGTTLLLRFAS
jgi:uncharacterized protein (TIGR02266 family)